jgi:hypothetical protein
VTVPQGRESAVIPRASLWVFGALEGILMYKKSDLEIKHVRQMTGECFALT